MKAKLYIVALIACLISSIHTASKPRPKIPTPSGSAQSPLQSALGDIGKELGGELLNSAKAVIGKLTTYITDNLLGNHPFQVVLGRTVRIQQNGNTVSIQDVSSGLSVTGHGDTTQDALSVATTEYVALMLKIGIISKDDLHLAPIRTTTGTPCGNNFPISYCDNYRHMCSNSALSSFLRNNCYKTCSGC